MEQRMGTKRNVGNETKIKGIMRKAKGTNINHGRDKGNEIENMQSEEQRIEKKYLIINQQLPHKQRNKTMKQN